MSTYTEASPEAGMHFYRNFQNKGNIVMLNLLKFKTTADYTNFEALKPATPISGKEAYLLYLNCMKPKFKTLGSHMLYLGSCQNFLIGPEWEQWDAILMVEHESLKTFTTLSKSKTYLNYVGHRFAALEDSRLLPSSEVKV